MFIYKNWLTYTARCIQFERRQLEKHLTKVSCLSLWSKKFSSSLALLCIVSILLLACFHGLFSWWSSTCSPSQGINKREMKNSEVTDGTVPCSFKTLSIYLFTQTVNKKKLRNKRKCYKRGRTSKWVNQFSCNLSLEVGFIDQIIQISFWFCFLTLSS